eukprot:11457554-Alexandrium_andersonii.AAC.1
MGEPQTMADHGSGSAGRRASADGGAGCRRLALTSFPGLTDDINPIMRACYSAWNQFVVLVGPEFASKVTGDEAARLTADPTR